jgi:beta-apo-4'-carotenal oxygenase
MESLIDIRYPPYKGKLGKFQKMSNSKPDFDRNGKVKFSLAKYILTLGAESSMGGLARYAFVLLGKSIQYRFLCDRVLDADIY